MSSPAMSSSRRFILQRMMFSSKPYPIGRDLPLKQRPTFRGPSSSLLSRVRFLINDISDLDVAAKHARLAARKKMNPEIATLISKTIIGAMCNAGRSDDALDLFDLFLNKSKIKPDIACCNFIIKSHCEQGRLDEALGIYSHLLSNKPSPDHNTYDILTKAMVDAGMMDQALDLLLKGRADLSNFEKPGMYMNLIRGYLEQRNLDMAYQLRGDFKTCSIRNEIAILESVFVEYLFKQGKDEEAMDLYRSAVTLNKNGLTENAIVGNVYLKLLLKYGRKTQAWALFEYMLDYYDLCYTWEDATDALNLMVNECFEMGRFSDAMDIFTKAKAKVKYNSVLVGVYRNLITRLCQNGRLSEAESLFDELLKEEVLPDDETYKAMIRAYAKSGRVEDAVETANKMMTSKVHKVTKLFF
ncbi:PREDICTED: pentatricopeptide repeat-containing protein At3g60980, mitochondrial-like [Camelina sativa]|uniref:Pentatricopeptide repeat-containing protein At3g60980, mitochondrial-like n=1 Tax=Camelina sativa TaxID=90675 RepID=A0ABM0V666_CAMSA|nr:PREDICTED: pentatricopeptide repeat-containing protein At3g60980, mitochondrial-like [Camelina sativa]